MGDYTELRVRATIKPKYRQLMDWTINGEGRETWPDRWKAAYYLNPDFDWLPAWTERYRADMIPYGGSSYFQDDPDWEHVFRMDDGFLQFQCNLKNYDSDIEYFLDNVLPEIAEAVIECWMHFEYDAKPKKIDVRCF